MRTTQALAQVFRATARILAVFLLPSIVFYMLFVGLQLASGEPGFIGLTLNLLLLLLLSAGFVIAWWREALGGVISLGALAVFIILGVALTGFGPTFSSSPLVWPLSLFVALIRPQSFDPVPNGILVAAWTLTAAPIVLFLASWLLRRKLK